jgi:hypothetical protein
MNQKSKVWHGCAMVIVLISTIAFGEIIYTGEQGSYSSATANSSTPYDEVYAGGEEFVYTTVGGVFYYRVNGYAYVFGEMTLVSGQGCTVEAYARGETADSVVTDAFVMFSDSGTGGRNPQDDDGPYSHSTTGGALFSANEGLLSRSYSYAAALITEGYSDTAHSLADAWAYSTMWE